MVRQNGSAQITRERNSFKSYVVGRKVVAKIVRA